MNARLHYLVGTAVAPADAGAQLTVSWGGGFIPAANDRIAVLVAIDSRPGIPQSVTYGAEYRLRDIAQNTQLQLGVRGGSAGGPRVSGSIYSAPSPLINVLFGFDYEPLTNTRAVTLQWRLGRVDESAAPPDL